MDHRIVVDRVMAFCEAMVRLLDPQLVSDFLRYYHRTKGSCMSLEGMDRVVQMTSMNVEA